MERSSIQGQQAFRNSFHLTSKIKENIIPVNHNADY